MHWMAAVNTEYGTNFGMQSSSPQFVRISLFSDQTPHRILYNHIVLYEHKLNLALPATSLLNSISLENLPQSPSALQELHHLCINSNKNPSCENQDHNKMRQKKD